MKQKEQVLIANKKDAPHERSSLLKQLKIYTIQAFASLAIFVLFLATSILADWICSIYPQVRIMIMFKIVAWIISVCGAICCITLMIRNTIVLIKFLLRVPPQETPSQEVSNEGREE